MPLTVVVASRRAPATAALRRAGAGAGAGATERPLPPVEDAGVVVVVGGGAGVVVAGVVLAGGFETEPERVVPLAVIVVKLR